MRWILVGAIWLGGMTSAVAEPIRVCEQPDGRLVIIHWATSDKTTPPDLAGLPCADRDDSELPDRSRRDAWRKRPDGSIKADPTIEIASERRERLQREKSSLMRQKLGLTPQEFEDLREALKDE